MPDKRDKLYQNLISMGLTTKELGTQDEFKAFVTDESKVRKVYQNLKNDGAFGDDFEDTEDQWADFVRSDFEQVQQSPNNTAPVKKQPQVQTPQPDVPFWHTRAQKAAQDRLMVNGVPVDPTEPYTYGGQKMTGQQVIDAINAEAMEYEEKSLKDYLDWGHEQMGKYRASDVYNYIAKEYGVKPEVISNLYKERGYEIPDQSKFNTVSQDNVSPAVQMQADRDLNKYVKSHANERSFDGTTLFKNLVKDIKLDGQYTLNDGRTVSGSEYYDLITEQYAKDVKGVYDRISSGQSVDSVEYQNFAYRYGITPEEAKKEFQENGQYRKMLESKSGIKIDDSNYNNGHQSSTGVVFMSPDRQTGMVVGRDLIHDSEGNLVPRDPRQSSNAPKGYYYNGQFIGNTNDFTVQGNKIVAKEGANGKKIEYSMDGNLTIGEAVQPLILRDDNGHKTELSANASDQMDYIVSQRPKLKKKIDGLMSLFDKRISDLKKKGNIAREKSFRENAEQLSSIGGREGRAMWTSANLEAEAAYNKNYDALIAINEVLDKFWAAEAGGSGEGAEDPNSAGKMKFKQLLGNYLYKQMEDKLVNEKMPKSAIEYILKGILDSDVATIIRSTVQNDYDRYLDMLANDKYISKMKSEGDFWKSIGVQSARGIVTFFGDSWEFLLPGAAAAKAGGATTKAVMKKAVDEITETLVKRNVKRKLANEIAERIASRAILPKLAGAAVSGGTVMSAATAISTPLKIQFGDVSLGAEKAQHYAMTGDNSKESMKEIERQHNEAIAARWREYPADVITSFLSGSAMSVWTPIGDKILKTINGTKGVVTAMAVKPFVEGTALNAVDIVLHGDNYTIDQALDKYATMIGFNFLHAKSGYKSMKAEQHLSRNYDFTDADKKRLKDMGYSDVADLISDIVEKESGQWTEYNYDENGNVVVYDKYTRVVESKLPELMRNGDIPETFRRKIYAVVTGDYSRPLSLVTHVELDNNGRTIKEYDKNGGLVRETDADNYEDAWKKVLQMQHQAEINETLALQEALVLKEMQDMPERIRNKKQSELTPEEKEFQALSSRIGTVANEVENLKQVIDQVTEQYGENSTEALAYKKRLAEAEQTLANFKSEIEAFTKKYIESSDVVERFIQEYSEETGLTEDIIREAVYGRDGSLFKKNHGDKEGTGKYRTDTDRQTASDFRNALRARILGRDRMKRLGEPPIETDTDTFSSENFDNSQSNKETTTSGINIGDESPTSWQDRNGALHEGKATIEDISYSEDGAKTYTLRVEDNEGNENFITVPEENIFDWGFKVPEQKAEETAPTGHYNITEGQEIKLWTGRVVIDKDRGDGTYDVTLTYDDNGHVVKTTLSGQEIYEAAEPEYRNKLTSQPAGTTPTESAGAVVEPPIAYETGKELNAVWQDGKGTIIIKDGRTPDGKYNVIKYDETTGETVTDTLSASEINSIVTDEPTVIPETTIKSQVNGMVGRSLSEEESKSLISYMEANVEDAPVIELNEDTWEEQFPEGKVSTPLGEAKFGENQLAKMFLKNRQGEFGMLKPTLENPDVIIEEPSTAENAERNSSFLFVKTFNYGGKKYKFYTSVTVQKDGMEVVISNHISGRNAIIKKMQDGKILHLNDKLSSNSSDNHLAENQTGLSDLLPTQEESVISGGKGSDNSANAQENIENSSINGEKINAPIERTAAQKEYDAIAAEHEGVSDTNEKAKRIGADIRATITDLDNRVAKIQQAATAPVSRLDSQAMAKRDQARQQLAQLQQAKDYWNEVLAEHNAQLVKQQKEIEEKAKADEFEKRKAEAEAKRKAEEEAAILAAAEGATPIEKKWNNAPKHVGRKKTINLPDGSTLTGHYVLTQSGAATASHDPFRNYASSEGFPTDEAGNNVNDRDYQGDATQRKETELQAAQYDGRAIDDIPVVSKRGIVYSGNGRTMAGDIAAKNNTDAAYVKQLREDADMYGFTPEQVAEMGEHPRLLFVPDEELPYTTATFAKFNVKASKGQGNVAKAVKASKQLSEQDVQSIVGIMAGVDGEGGYANIDSFFNSEKGTNDLILALQERGILQSNEIADYVENGKFNNAGKDYVKNLLLGTMFDADAIKVISEVPSVKNALVSAMNPLLENTRLGDYSTKNEVSNAARLIAEAKGKGFNSVADYMRQTSLFGQGADQFTEFEKALALAMDGGVENFRNALSEYNKTAAMEKEGSIFGAMTPDEVKAAFIADQQKKAAASNNTEGDTLDNKGKFAAKNSAAESKRIRNLSPQELSDELDKLLVGKPLADNQLADNSLLFDSFEARGGKIDYANGVVSKYPIGTEQNPCGIYLRASDDLTTESISARREEVEGIVSNITKDKYRLISTKEELDTAAWDANDREVAEDLHAAWVQGAKGYYNDKTKLVYLFPNAMESVQEVKIVTNHEKSHEAEDVLNLNTIHTAKLIEKLMPEDYENAKYIIENDSLYEGLGDIGRADEIVSHTFDTYLAEGRTPEVSGEGAEELLNTFNQIKNYIYEQRSDKRSIEKRLNDNEQGTVRTTPQGFGGTGRTRTQGKVQVPGTAGGEEKTGKFSSGTTPRYEVGENPRDYARRVAEANRKKKFFETNGTEKHILETIKKSFRDSANGKKEQAAVVDFLSKHKDGQAMLEQIQKHDGTNWAKQSVNSILAKAGLEKILRGEEPDFINAFSAIEKPDEVGLRDRNNLWVALRSGKPDDLLRYVGDHIVSHTTKAVNSINGSYADCRPSTDCAKFCYASKGNFIYSNNIRHAELVTWAIENHPEKIAERIINEYRYMGLEAMGQALRLFDRGDMNEAWLPVVKALNERGVTLQIFSKRPELLKQIDQNKNVVMLSVDNSNIELIDKNPELPIAFVYSGKKDIPVLEKAKERFLEKGGVILPVKIGKSVLPKEVIDAMPAWSKPFQCPIDAGRAEIGKVGTRDKDGNKKWNCSMCDNKGGVGCFYHRTNWYKNRNNGTEQPNKASLGGLYQPADSNSQTGEAGSRRNGLRTLPIPDATLSDVGVRRGLLSVLRKIGLSESDLRPEHLEIFVHEYNAGVAAGTATGDGQGERADAYEPGASGQLGERRVQSGRSGALDLADNISNTLDQERETTNRKGRFFIGKKKRAEYEALLDKKQPDMPEKWKKEALDYLHSLEDTKDNNRKIKVAVKWLAEGTIRLPEDMEKVEDALSVADKAKVDPMAYKSPMDLMENHKQFKPSARPINPDTVPTLRNKQELANGVVVYDVDNTQESRENMRKIINTHFGEDCSPWCLLQGDGNGNLTEQSARYWDHYGDIQKQVAFQNGKLLAFRATNEINQYGNNWRDTAEYNISENLSQEYGLNIKYEDGECYIDVPMFGEYDILGAAEMLGLDAERYGEYTDGDIEDESTWEWSNYRGCLNDVTKTLQEVCDSEMEEYKKLHEDEAASFGQQAYDDEVESWWDRQDEPHVGIPQSGEISNDRLKEYFDEGTDILTDVAKGKKIVGTFEILPNGTERGQLTNLHSGNKKNGEYTQYDEESGRLIKLANFKHGKLHGRAIDAWYTSGDVYVRNYKDGELHGLQTCYDANWNVKEKTNYKNGDLDGERIKYWSDGSVMAQGEFKDGHLVGRNVSYYSTGGINEERFYDDNGNVHGDVTEWYEDGNVKRASSHNHGKMEGLDIMYREDGSVISKCLMINGLSNRAEYYRPDGILERYQNGIYEHPDKNGYIDRDIDTIIRWNHDGEFEFFAAHNSDTCVKIIDGKATGFIGSQILEDADVPRVTSEDFLSGTPIFGVKYEPVEKQTVDDIDRASMSERSGRFSVVKDKKTIEWLDASEKVTGYRNVVLHADGTLGSPMAGGLRSKGNKQVKTEGFEMYKWEQSEENPHLANDKGKINLVKPNGSAVDNVDYNPYIHNRPNKLNKQFKQAWERPDLVYIETEIPLSDLESGYHAEKAVKSVGIHNWPTPTSKQKLILSRYDKPVRFVPWEEVADDWEVEFKKSGVNFDIVPPALLPILARRGVKILPPHKGMGADCDKAYLEFKAKNERGWGFALPQKIKDDAIKQINNRIAELNRPSETVLTIPDNRDAAESQASVGYLPATAGVQRAISGAKVKEKFGSPKEIIKNLASFIENMPYDDTISAETFPKKLVDGMGLKGSEHDSDYLSYSTDNGEKVRIRLSNHNGNAISIIKKGGRADKGYSIVIKYEGMPTDKRDRKFVDNKHANVVEFVYESPDNARMQNIAKSVFGLVDSGVFYDLADADEINPKSLYLQNTNKEQVDNSTRDKSATRSGRFYSDNSDDVLFRDGYETTYTACREAWEKAKLTNSGHVVIENGPMYVTFGEDARDAAMVLGKIAIDGMLEMNPGEYRRYKEQANKKGDTIREEYWGDWESYDEDLKDGFWDAPQYTRDNISQALQSHPELKRERELIKESVKQETNVVGAIDDYIQTLSDMMDNNREDIRVTKGAVPAITEAISEAVEMRERAASGLPIVVDAKFAIESWQPKEKPQPKQKDPTEKKAKTQKEWQETAPSNEAIAKIIWSDPQEMDVSTGEYYYGDNQELARAIKNGEIGAIKEAARRMALYFDYTFDYDGNVFENDEEAKLQMRDATVLVPVPSHTGKATYTKKLAKELSKLTGIPVADALRCKPYESSYDRKARGEKPDVPEMELTYDYDTQMDVQNAEVVVLIDNVEATGDTMFEAEMGISGYTNGHVMRFPFVKDSSKILPIGKENVLLSGEEAQIVSSQRRTMPQYMHRDKNWYKGKKSESWLEGYSNGVIDAEGYGFETEKDCREWLDIYSEYGDNGLRDAIEGGEDYTEEEIKQMYEGHVQAVRDHLANMTQQSNDEPWRNVQTAVVHTSNIRNRFPNLHAEAKKGDVMSAYKIVSKVVDKKKIASLYNEHPDALVVYPHAFNNVGRNALPSVFADQFADMGFEVDENIVQKNRPRHTDANRFDRILNRSRFAGKVETGREYILIDDHITSGATLRDLKDFIESRGGIVVAWQAIEGSAGATNIGDADSSKLQEQFNKLGITDEQLQELGISQSVKNLTKSEAAELIVLAKRGRDFRSKERQKISSRRVQTNKRSKQAQDSRTAGTGGSGSGEDFEAEKQRFAKLFGLSNPTEADEVFIRGQHPFGSGQVLSLHEGTIPGKHDEKRGFRFDGQQIMHTSKEGALNALRDQYPDVAFIEENGKVVATPWSEILKPRKRTKSDKAYAQREIRRAEGAVDELAGMMNIRDKVELIWDTSDLKGRRATAKGWFDPATGKITIVMPNNRSRTDVVMTLLHEGVSHYGLRELFGDDFDTCLDNIYNNVTDDIRGMIDEKAKKDGNTRRATEELMAEIAETMERDIKSGTGSWMSRTWRLIKENLIELLRKAGIKLGFKLTDNDLRYILWRSYRNLAKETQLRNSNIPEIAKDIKMREKLGIGKVADSITDPTDPNGGGGVRFRDDNTKERSGRFSTGSKPFYSNAAKAVEGISQDKATPEQWLKMIEKNGGLKKEEDKWMGLSDWLKENKSKTITKADVLNFIAENSVEIQEVEYDSNPIMYDILDDYNKKFKDYTYEASQEMGASSLPADWEQKAFERLVEEEGDDFSLAFEISDLGGGLEPVLDMNDNISEAALYYLSDGKSKAIDSTRLKYTTEGLANKREIALTVPSIEPYNTNDEIHFGDAGEGRAIAWLRFGDATDADGMKVLVIDEIQSKRHQDGRENGYFDENILKQKEEELKVRERTYYDADNAWREYRRNLGFGSPTTEGRMEAFRKSKTAEHSAKLSELEEARDKALDALNEIKTQLGRFRDGKDLVPDAPFRKNWHELAMKRALRYAAENGYDKVAWTTGAQQAKRYDLSGVVPKIDVYTDPHPAVGEEAAVKWLTFEINGKKHSPMVNRDGVFVSSFIIGNSQLQGKPISEVFGKEIADKVMSTKEKNETIEVGKVVGGEGMKGFYDQILPKFVSKYAKKWGAKVGEVELELPNETDRKMWSVDVTPEMRDSVRRGQPMFYGSDAGSLGRDWVDPEIERNKRAYLDRLNEAKEEANNVLTRLGGQNLLQQQGRTKNYLLKPDQQSEARRAIANFVNAALSTDNMSVFSKRALKLISSKVAEAKTTRMLRKHLMEAETVCNDAEIARLKMQIDSYLKLKIQDQNDKGISIGKLIDDDTRKVFEYMKGRTAELRATEVDDELKAVGAELREIEKTIKEALYEYGIGDAQNREERNAMVDANPDLETEYQGEQRTLADLKAMTEPLIEQQSNLKEQQEEIRAGKRDNLANWQDRLDELTNRFNSTEEGVKPLTENEKRELEGLQILSVINEADKLGYTTQVREDGQTQESVDSIRKQKKELFEKNRQLRMQLGENFGRDDMYIKQEINKNNNLIDNLTLAENAIKEQQIDFYRQGAEAMKQLIEDGHTKMMEHTEAEKERKAYIGIMGYRDVKKGNEWKEGQKQKGKLNTVKDFFFLSPFQSFEFMSQWVSNMPAGRGFLYNNFTTALVKAEETLATNIDRGTQKLNDKCQELFGCNFKQAAQRYGRSPWKPFKTYDSGIWVMNEDGETMVKDPRYTDIPKGTALQLWMWWQNPDGQMKMRQMGFNEESIQQIENYCGPKLIEFGQWLFGFYDKIGDRANVVHKMLYNTSMHRVANYSPLKIDDTQISEKNDLASGDNSFTKNLNKVNSSFINRTINLLPVSTEHTAFDIVSEHMTANEELIAFGRVRKDLDYLLNTHAFRNTLNANKAGSYDDFVNAALVAAHLTRETFTGGDRVYGMIMSGFASGAIGLRLWTGIKQVMSYPAFYAYKANPRYWSDVTARFWSILEAKPTIIMANVHWASENLPLFKARWNEGLAGNQDIIREVQSLDNQGMWRRIMDKYSKAGMLWNRFVDAMTCAAGARAIYDFEYRRLKKHYLKCGRDEQRAHELANQQALFLANNYNTTQQSSVKTYISPDQDSKTALNRIIGLFQNSNRGFTRQGYLGAKDILGAMSSTKRKFWIKQYMDNLGMKESEANKALAEDVATAACKFAMCGFAIKWIWDHTPKIGKAAIVAGMTPAAPILGGAIGGTAVGASVGSKLGGTATGALAGAGIGGVIGMALGGGALAAAISAFLNTILEDDEKRFDENSADNGTLLALLNEGAMWATYYTQGSVGGNMAHDIAWSGTVYNPFSIVGQTEMESLKKAYDNYGYSPELAAELLRRLPATQGINMDTFTNIYIGVKDLIDNGTDAHVAIDVMLMLNCPTSMRKDVAATMYKDYSLADYTSAMVKARKLADRGGFLGQFTGTRDVTSKDIQELTEEWQKNRVGEDVIKKYKELNKKDGILHYIGQYQAGIDSKSGTSGMTDAEMEQFENEHPELFKMVPSEMGVSYQDYISNLRKAISKINNNSSSAKKLNKKNLVEELAIKEANMMKYIVDAINGKTSISSDSIESIIDEQIQLSEDLKELKEQSRE